MTRPQSCPPLHKIREDGAGRVFDEDGDVNDPTTDDDANASLGESAECPHCRRRLISEEGSTVESAEGRASRTRKLSPLGANVLYPKNPWDSIWPYISLPKEATSGNEGAASGDEKEASSERTVDGAFFLNENVSFKSNVHAFDNWKTMGHPPRNEGNETHSRGGLHVVSSSYSSSLSSSSASSRFCPFLHSIQKLLEICFDRLSSF